ncbi:MAG: DUF721 domain-containing protein [Candidatus Omnitrophica bacterium]|nr:DUF721 domain-containing protein [Candidatus Omnitrophota bacterium]
MKKKKEAVLVGDLVKNLIKEIDSGNKIAEEDILKTWKSIVGEQAAKVTKPLEIRNAKLKISVQHPGWVQELTIRKRDILKKLGTVYGRDMIRDIGFTTQQG